MKPNEASTSSDDRDDFRRSVHDIAATLISIRALAEMLADHVPTLVAMSRSRHWGKSAPISPETLDSLPAIPAEIIELCAIARGTLQALGNPSVAAANADATSTEGSVHTARTPLDAKDKLADQEGIRVLLVEDEETVRYVLSQTLQARGWLVTSSRDGEEALRLLDKMDFDLVLMDLRLPGKNGLETTRQLRKKESALGRHTRVIGLTASPLMEDQVRAKAAGMDDVLIKPIDDRALRSILK